MIFGLGMRHYLRVRVGKGFGLINLVLLYSEYLYIFCVEPFVSPIDYNNVLTIEYIK